MTTHRKSSQLNCMTCDFQTNIRSSLENHINLKHTQEKDRKSFKCDDCKIGFSSTWHLNNHTRDEHEAKEECYHYKSNRCKFGNTCWKLHRASSNIESFTCFSCKESFRNMNELMKNRKNKHIDLCKPCLPKGGECRFKENPEKCWFVHKDFQMVGKKPVPPSSSSTILKSSHSIQSSQLTQPNQSSQCSHCQPNQSLTSDVQTLSKEALESSPSH